MPDRRTVATAENAPPADAATLNRRDVEVLRCLAEGRSTSQIAGQLAVSTNTARTRIRRVQARLAVSDRAAAVRRAQDLGVITLPRPRGPLG